MRICKKCGNEKDISLFKKDGHGYIGHTCNECSSIAYKNWRIKNKDRVLNYQRQWINNNSDKHNEYNRNRMRKLKSEVLAHYGNRCACCGETEPIFLTIDHVNNDGAAHRKQIHGDKIYPHIIKANFPDTFQILCWNCNLGKQLNDGTCPHKTQ